jgi:hypothetical protein
MLGELHAVPTLGSESEEPVTILDRALATLGDHRVDHARGSVSTNPILMHVAELDTSVFDLAKASVYGTRLGVCLAGLAP